MGWKNVKEHYRIVHQVRVEEKGICIGSPYISDIIVIGLDGVLKKRDDGHANSNLKRYMQEFDADPEKLNRLVTTPDTFTNSVVVYTYEGSKIIEKLCETPGWPNVTHDGLMMYDNTFSTDRSKVVEFALSNAQAGVSLATARVGENRRRLAEAESWLAECLADVSVLKKMQE